MPRDNRGTQRKLSLIPGGGQFYRGDFIRGGLALSALTALAVVSVQSQRELSTRVTAFEATRREYEGARTEHAALVLGNRAEELYDLVLNQTRKRNLLLGAAAAIYLLQVGDGMRAPRQGFRVPVDKSYLLDPVIGTDGAAVRLRIGH